MPTVVINDVAMEARIGERLLAVARRNAAHIGFVCGGNGICQTCQCRVLAGGEFLSSPSALERAWMPEHRLRRGHRLACQAGLRGRGPVELITNAEELRRQLFDVIDPPAGADRADLLDPLLENLVRLNLDQLLRYPFNVIEMLLNLKGDQLLQTLREPQPYIDDAYRVTTQTLAAVGRRPSPRIPRASGYEARLLRAAEAIRQARESAA
jgi:chlorosome envelope protein I